MNSTVAIILICVLVAFIAFSFILQTRRLNRSKLGKVMDIYRNIRYNERLVNKFGYKKVSDRFRTAAWDKHKHDIDFLPGETVAELTNLFDDIHKTNEDIASTVEGRGETALYRVNVDALKVPLLSMRKYLDHWIKVNYNNPQVAPRRPGFFGI